MPDCEHYDICGLTAEADPEAGLCILHSKNPEKNKEAFAAALKAHRKKRRDNFRYIVFPVRVDFRNATFTEEVDFSRATFTKEANFFGATFTKWADFGGATFTEEVDFSRATFTKGANFSGATFSGETNFTVATFSGETSFEATTFKGQRITFSSSCFRGRTLFTSRRENNESVPIFSKTKADFRRVVIDPPDAITFLEADFSKTMFLDTDLRKVQITGAIWPEIGSRFGVYDEIAPLKPNTERSWVRIERIYRELKQNYEDRRDYGRVGDFHYGEKEMRRRNPETPRGLRVLLALYWLSSGYGEQYLRPLIGAGILLTVCTFGYLALGISPDKGGSSLSPTNIWDWLQAIHYSFRVMTFLRPTDFVPLGSAKVVHTIQSLLGPIFIGLFALAVRQRLKR